MGYMTTYSISAFTEDGPLSSETINDHLHEYRHIIDLYESHNPDEHTVVVWAKWYTCDNDMIEVSTANPDVTYRIYGNGEEINDEWVCFYKDGQVEEHVRPVWVEPAVPERI